MTVLMPSVLAASKTSSGVGTGTRGAAAVGVHERLRGEERVAGRSGEAVGGERRGERLGAAHEVVGLDGGEAARGEVGEGAVEVGLECLVDGEQLDGCQDRHRSVLLRVVGDGGGAIGRRDET